MSALRPFGWWRLDLEILSDLEESLIWKLDELGIKRFSFKYSPDNTIQRKLQVWLPVNEFSEKADFHDILIFSIQNQHVASLRAPGASKTRSEIIMIFHELS